jgi:Methyltransferase domain
MAWHDRNTQDWRRCLFPCLPRHGIGAEVGVWRGDFSSVFLQETAPRQLHLIDPWQFRSDPKYSEASYGGKLASSQEDMDELFELVCRRFAEDESVIVHRCTSQSGSGRFANASLDWVYLDAEHWYEAVSTDLAVWAPKVKPGGLLMGDDYGATGYWGGGVTRAVDEFVGSGACEVVLLEGNQFVLRLTGSW